GLLAHVVQDRPLGPGGDDRLGDALHPDARPAPSPALVADDRVERVDPVGAGVLAEAEEDHARSVGHERIITEPRAGRRTAVASPTSPKGSPETPEGSLSSVRFRVCAGSAPKGVVPRAAVYARSSAAASTSTTRS